MTKLCIRGPALIFFFLYFFNVFAEDSTGTGEVLELESNISDVPGIGAQYNGEQTLSQEATSILVRQVEASQSRDALEDASERDCEPDGVPSPDAEVEPTTFLAQDSDPDGDGSNWQVVFMARLGVRSDSVGGQTSVTPMRSGSARFRADQRRVRRHNRNGTLTPEVIDEMLSRSGDALGNDPDAAMAYVASLGNWLNGEYGDSNAGTFVSRYEQYGRRIAGESVGQCSDIHFAMLRAYKQMVGEDAKAYLVNFQTGGNLHHTNLVIENDGELSIIDYGNIQTNSTGQLDMLAQDRRAGHGIAYRVFTDSEDGTIDTMVAHIDTPLGKLLREVTTGNSSYNPFERNDYTLVQLGAQNETGSHVRTFFGELGGGDIVVGVAANLEGVAELGAGFNLHGYVSGALSYAHRQYRVDNNTESLHSEIIYLNTGLGLISPQLDLGDFSFGARTDLALEGGFWFKQYSDMDDDDSNIEADGNLVSRTSAYASWSPTDNFRLDANVELELVPSFATAFPSSTDGSSGADGFGDTFGVRANRVTTSLSGTYTTDNEIDIFAGIIWNQTLLGAIGEARVGVATAGFQASAFVQGALDRDETPIFMPGARRSVGADINYCTQEARGQGESGVPGVCLGASFLQSLEDDAWTGNVTTEVRF